MAFNGISITVVTPPKAAALVPVQKPSHSVLPGSLRCTCASTRPGRRMSGLWSWYTVSGEKFEEGRMEVCTSWIFPLLVFITIVAGVTRPEITARDETRTVSDGFEAVELP
jgi:hypothetical protein